MYGDEIMSEMAGINVISTPEAYYQSWLSSLDERSRENAVDALKKMRKGVYTEILLSGVKTRTGVRTFQLCGLSSDESGVTVEGVCKEMTTIIREQRTRKEKVQDVIDHYLKNSEATLTYSLKDGTIMVLKHPESVTELSSVFSAEQYAAINEKYIENSVFNRDKESVRAALDLSTVRERMEGRDSISTVYRRRVNGSIVWVKFTVLRLSKDELLLNYENCGNRIIEGMLNDTLVQDLISAYYCDLIGDCITEVKRSPVFSLLSDRTSCRISELLGSHRAASLADEEFRDEWIRFISVEHIRKALKDQNRIDFNYSSHVTGSLRWVKASIFVMKRIEGVASEIILTFSNVTNEQVENITLNRQTARQNVMLEENLAAINGLASEYTVLVLRNLDTDGFIPFFIREECSKFYTEEFSLTSFPTATQAFTTIMEEICHPEDLNRMLLFADVDYVRDIMSDCKRHSERIRLRNLKGEYVWNDFVLIKFEMPDAPATKVAVGFVNVDRQVRLETEKSNELVRLEAFSNFLLDTYVSAYYVGLKDFSTIVFKSTGYLERKYPDSENYIESINRYIASDVHPDDREMMYEMVRPEYVRGRLREVPSFSVMLRDMSDGTEKNYRFQVVRGADDSHAVFAFIDMTSEMAKEKNRLQAIKDSERSKEIVDRYMEKSSAMFTVNLLTDSIVTLKKNPRVHDPLNFRDSDGYRQCMRKYVNNIVIEADRPKMAEVSQLSAMRRRLAQDGTYSINYRKIVDGFPLWHTMMFQMMGRDEVLVNIENRDAQIVEEMVADTFVEDKISAYFCDIDGDRIVETKKSPVFSLVQGQSSCRLSEIITSDSIALLADDEYKEGLKEFLNLEHAFAALMDQNRLDYTYSSHITGELRWVKASIFVISRRNGLPSGVVLTFSNATHEQVENMKLNKETLIQKHQLEQDFKAIEGLSTEYAALQILNLKTGRNLTLSLGKKTPKEVMKYANVKENFAEANRSLINDFCHPDYRERVLALCTAEGIKRTLRKTKRHVERVPVLVSEGTYKWFDFVCLKFDPEKEEATSIAVGLINVDEQVRSEIAQHEAQEEIRATKQASLMKSRFVQNVSHDIRTPLNAIVGYSQLLSMPDGTISPKEKEEFAVHIQDSADMLTMLVDDVLSASDIENNILSMNWMDAPCNEICRKAVNCSKLRVQSGVRMYFTSEVSDQYTANTDPKRIQQILVNYLSNACKHTTHGEIHVHCSTSENPGYITFSVTDTGCGVSKDMAEMIFEQFRMTGVNENHGMGLSICKNLALRLSGEVRLDTSYKEGARFLLIIPDRAAKRKSEEELALLRKNMVGTWELVRDEFYVFGHNVPLAIYNATSPCIIEIFDDLSFEVTGTAPGKKKKSVAKGICTIQEDGTFMYEETIDGELKKSRPRYLVVVDDKQMVYRVDRSDFNDPFSTYPHDIDLEYDFDLCYYNRIK